MPMGPIADIRSILSVSPQELIITSVRTKKICIQDILTQNNLDISRFIAPYEPPKIVDLIKQGMTAVTIEELKKEIEKKKEELSKENTIESIKQALEMKLLENAGNMPTNPINSIMPPEVNVPVVSYEPLYGGQMQEQQTQPPGFPFDFSRITSMFGNISNMFQRQFEMGQQSTEILSSVHSLVSGLREMMYNFWKLIGPELKSTHGDVLINRDVFLKGNQYTIDTIHLVSKAMSKSMADYFRNMVINLINNGCAYFPVGLSGTLNVRVINNSVLPQAIAFTNVVVKSMDYVLSKPTPFSVFAGPMETDVVHIPILVENVDAVDYILNHRGKGTIPITLTANIKVGPLQQTITFSEGNVVVR